MFYQWTDAVSIPQFLKSHKCKIALKNALFFLNIHLKLAAYREKLYASFFTVMKVTITINGKPMFTYMFTVRILYQKRDYYLTAAN